MKLFFVSILAALAFALPAINVAAADPLEAVCAKPSAKNSPTCQQYFEQKGDSTNPNPVVSTIQTAANLIAIVAVIGAVIIIIISGFKYVTAGGSIGGSRAGDSPTKAKEAQATLVGAVIGLIVVAFAWTIVNFVTSRLIHT
ncbi:MAG: hypothetical protein WD887_00395 [Candidatus Saccharimonadales bacterium]